MNILPYQHVNFNADWAAAQKLEDFIAHENHHGLTEKELKEAHALCVAKVKPAPAAAAPAKEVTPK